MELLGDGEVYNQIWERENKSQLLPSSVLTGKFNQSWTELALFLIQPSHPPTHQPTRKSSDLAGVQQNVLYNIDRYSQADLKCGFKKNGGRLPTWKFRGHLPI